MMSSNWSATPGAESRMGIIELLSASPHCHRFILTVLDKFTELFHLHSQTSPATGEETTEVLCRCIASDSGSCL